MAEYIDREAFVIVKRKQYCEDCERRKGMKNGKLRFCYEIGDAPCRACSIDDMLGDVEDFPAADVKPVVRGKWIIRTDVAPYRPDGEITSWTYKCAICGTLSRLKYNYCPNCGARMDGDEDD